MKLTINGVVFHDSSSAPPAGRAWHLLAQSTVRAGSEYVFSTSERAGFDGEVFAGRRRKAAILKLRIATPADSWEALQAFMSPSSLLISVADQRSAEGSVIFVSEPEQARDVDRISAWFHINIPEGCWRGPWADSPILTPAAGGKYLSLFPGLSAPVQDATVHFEGPIVNPFVQDTAGSFFMYEGNIPSGWGLSFEAETGRARLYDPNADYEEVSGLVDFGGPRGVFEITPRIPNLSAPAVREGRLNLRQSSYGSGARMHVYGRSAHLI